MFPSLVLAATTVATQFFDDFRGNWTCGNASYRAQWSVTSPDGDYWTIVQYGLDAQHPGGTAYVGWLAQKNVFFYNDFHNDGSFAQLTAPPPTNRVWHWTGVYYAAGKQADPTADITWTLTPNGTIVRRFAQRIDGKIIDRGSDVCMKR
jgi:hypothetical protein